MSNITYDEIRKDHDGDEGFYWLLRKGKPFLYYVVDQHGWVKCTWMSKWGPLDLVSPLEFLVAVGVPNTIPVMTRDP